MQIKTSRSRLILSQCILQSMEKMAILDLLIALVALRFSIIIMCVYYCMCRLTMDRVVICKYVFMNRFFHF